MTPPKKIFGTDGVRGTANIEPVTAETALKVGRAAGHVFKRLERQSRSRGRHKIVLGKDTRLSGYMLENALSSGILSMGVDVLFIGPLPTPGVAYVTRSLRADAGMVITASHNPYDDNGIKFFRADGYKLDDNIEYQIESLVFSGEIENIRPTADEVGKAVRIDDALGRYIEYAKSSFPRGMTLEGLRIVVDCAHGAAYKSTPCVLRELGAEVIVYGNQPDGKNINKDCGSMHPALMCQKIWEHRADLGIAHDGDADRAVFVDDRGRYVEENREFALIAHHVCRRRQGVIVTPVSTSQLIEDVASANGCTVRYTAVGSIYVARSMLGLIDQGIEVAFGGEGNGGLIYPDHQFCRDGGMTAAMMVALLAETGRPLSELIDELPPYHFISEKKKSSRIDEIVPAVVAAFPDHSADLTDGVRIAKQKTWALVRQSGTEPIVRIMVEAPDRAGAEAMRDAVLAVITPFLD